VLGVEIRIVFSVACHFNDHAIREQQQQQQPSCSYGLLEMYFTAADRSLWQGAFRYDKCLQAKKNYDHAAYRSGLLQSYETGKDMMIIIDKRLFIYDPRRLCQ
jgi:hypothetical protein